MTLQPLDAPYPHWCFADPASGDLLRLVPERGGLLTGWRCGGREILYLDAERFADPALSVRGGMPVLFPICGNLPADTLVLPSGRYPLKQHGFARDLPWSLEPLADAAGVALELNHSPESLARYPFSFRLRLELRLEPSALAITARIAHSAGADGAAPADGGPAPEPMPFSFGLHPYLAVSDPAAVVLQGLPPACIDHRVMAAAATADQLPQLGQGVDFLCSGAGAVRLLDEAAGLAVSLETSTPFDCAVIWSEPPRPMLCLEPWTAPRGSLLSGERRLELAAGQEISLQCRYRVQTLA